MSINQYLRAAGYKIGNVFEPIVADGYDNDVLIIKTAGGYNVDFDYRPATGSPYRGSWNNASGTYDPKYDIITGTLSITPPGGGPAIGGWFSIALDRKLPQPSRLPYIHVFVKRSDGGAPDEGSYTGQGN